LDGLNTSAFAEGVQLYLSATTAGGYTSTKQYAPNHLVYIGVVTRQHVNQGRIEVRIQNGYEMDELHDVAAQTPSNNDGLFYNSTNSLWENKSIATALGYTPANAATTLTINGVTYDLSTSRTFTVGSVTGSGASGQVAYWDGTTSQAGSNNLFWDAANGRLGIGTNAPSYTLEVRTNLAVPVEVGFRTANAFSNMAYGTMIANVEFSGWKGGGFGNENAAIQVYYNGDGTNRKGKMHLLVAESTNLGSSNITLSQSTTNNKITIIGTLGNSYNDTIASPSLTTTYAQHANTIINGDGGIPILSIDRLGVVQSVVFANGNFSVGGTTDNGQRLQVQGTTLLNGNVTFSSSTGMFWDATNSLLGIGTNAPVYRLNVISASGTATAGIGVTNNGTGTSDFASYNLINNSNLLSQLFFTGSNYTLSTMIGANGLGFYNEGSGGITIWAGNASGSIKFATGVNVTSGSEKMSLYSNGNLGIGTGNTDSGERLQVTGTTRLNGVLTVTAPSGYIAQSFKSQYTAVGYLGGDNTAAWVGTGADGLVNSILCGTTTNYVSFRVNNAQRLIVQSTGNVSIGNSNDTYRLDVSGSIRSSSGGIISTNTSSASDAFYTLLSSNIRFYVSAGGYCKTTSNIVTDTNGTTSLNASAILQADSTTKGFLPPRMTTTQKNAISSPAAGLVVYDTTDNKHYGYDGTTWNAFY
jgi:hypothetical protein